MFPLLRSIIDKKRVAGRFLITGSASPDLLLESTETLAGRISYVELTPLSWREVKGGYGVKDIWLRGGFPNSLLSENDMYSFQRRKDFINAYIERKLPLLGLGVSSVAMRRLLRMLSHVHGQLLNYSELSRSLGVSLPTLRKYLDYLEYTFLIRRMEPYHHNVGKRLVKSPEIYMRDTGLLHAIAGISDIEELEGYHAKGASWEGLVVEQVATSLKSGFDICFYRTANGAELDMVVLKELKPILGIEVKYSSSPSVSKGSNIAAEDLNHIPVWVVAPGVKVSYMLNQHTTVIDFTDLHVKLIESGLVEG